MKFTSPAGRTYSWDKDTAPSQEDIDAIVAYDASLGKPEQANAQMPGGSMREAVAGSVAAAAPWLADTIRNPKQAAASAARVGVPLAAALMSGGASVPATLAFTGTGALTGELGARVIEGGPAMTSMEMGRTAALGAAMAPVNAAGSIGLKAVGGALEGAALTAEGAVQKGEMPSPLDAFIGVSLGAVGRGAEGLAVNAAQRNLPKPGISERFAAADSQAAAVEQAANAQRAADFQKARAELAANDLEATLKESAFGPAKPVEASQPVSRETALDVKFGPGEGAAKERARIEAAKPKPPADPKAYGMRMSSQASRMMDEYGGINTSVMAAAARGAAGMGIGAIQGDTPDEKLGYGLTYAAIGALASPALARKMGTAAMETKVGRAFYPEHVIKPFMEAIRSRGGEYESMLLAPKLALQKMEKAVNAMPAQAQSSAKDTLRDYLLGNTNIAYVHPALKDAALEARKALDDMSAEMVGMGMVKGQTAQTVTDNIGRYLRRSYKVFLDKDWRPSDATFKKFVDENVNDALSRNLHHSVPQLEQHYRDVANRLLDRDTANAFIHDGQISVDQGIFRPRKELDAVTRELLGEVDDPFIMLSDTAPRMARSVAAYKMQANIAEIGQRLGLLSKNSGTTQGMVEIVPSGTQRNALAGLWTTPEIRDAFASVAGVEQQGKTLERFAKMSSIVKMPKTLGSLKAYSSNVWGGLLDTMAQGHMAGYFDKENVGRALKTSGINLGVSSVDGKISQDRAFQFYKFLVSERLINKSVTGQDFLNAISPRGMVASGASKVIDKAGKAYMTPESFGKVINFGEELKAVREAFPKMSQESQMKLAAEKVRATTADYDYLPKAARQLSTYAVLDPFIAYTADRFRVVYNTYRIGMAELKSGNPALMRAGAKRIVGMTTVLGVAGLVGANSHLDKDRDQALRNRLPMRDKNGFLSMSDVNEDKTFEYRNLNYTIPQTIAVEAASAAMRGDSPKQSAQNAMGVMAEQLFGSSLLLNPVVDVFRGETSSGKKVWNPLDSPAGIVADSAQHIGSEWFVPLLAKEIDKAMKLNTQIAETTGAKYTNEDLIKSNLLGIRTYRVHLPTTLKREAREHTTALQDAQVSYSSLRKTETDQSKLATAYNKLEERRKTAFDKITGIIADSRKLGMKDDEIVKVLRDGGVSSRMLAGAFDGIYVPSNPNEVESANDMIDRWRESGMDNKRIDLQIQGVLKNKDYAKYKQLVEARKTERRAELLKVDDTDKLITAFSESDGARADYVGKKYDSIKAAQGSDAAMSYYKELMRKRLVGAETHRRMAQKLRGR